jgi:carbohydrate-selective porin OprB
MKSVRFSLCLLAAMALVIPVVAQEGYPLAGTWSGDWGTSTKEEERTDTTLVLNWDGKAVQGIVDPGPDSAKIRVATLDTTKWTVHLEYDLKDKAGKVTPFIVDGKLQNPASRKDRMIVGNYTHGTAKGDFKIKMD